MPSVPDTLPLGQEPVAQFGYANVRRVALALLAVVVGLALLNVFGGRPTTSVEGTPDAKLTVYAPEHVRSGLAYTARFRIDAKRELKDATLVLSSGWTEGYTVSGSAPQAVREGNRNGRITYSFGTVPAGEHLTFYLSLRVDPSNVGLRTADVELDDGDSEILTVYREVLVLP